MNRLAATASRTETYCGIDIGGTTNSWNYADTVPCQTGIRAEKRRRGRRH